MILNGTMAMSLEDLNKLLLDVESDLAERKESLSSSAKSRVAEAVCAFANDLPNHRKTGVVFIGVEDRGNVVGTPITDDLLLQLSSLRSDGNILPFPQVTVRKLTLTGPNGVSGEVAVVETEPSPGPPVRYKGQVWIRVGPSRALATRDEERILNEKRRWRDLPFDQTPLISTNVRDLDLLLFERTYMPSALSPQVIDENGRSTVQQLASLRLYSPEADAPTVSGVLVVGKAPRDAVPGAYVQFVRYSGVELTDDIMDQKEISGPLPDLIQQLDDVLKANIRVATDFTSGDTETRAPDYPLVALQQLTRNALMHRNYESSYAPIRLMWFTDRIEIHSPGGPFGQVTHENFGQPGITDYRNPTMAEAMKNLGFVQRFGVGIALARKTLADNHNPPVTFDVQSTQILATITTRAGRPEAS